ncbi:DUF3379 family protein [Oleiharenicola lentus]|uniref:DUF3379 family protein n=1 Tax=Oleiharenicola lentus TaxID=2508720 RepID=A0A4Q1C3B8_9BACT|nr:DUF3379 family protein [Oleiharenicola lentus]RXK52837.1 DUF3379 family protein [Oleiharenicola lentus]
MNNEEAKFILQGYRPNGTDASDATFSAALEQARKDPALAEWLAKMQAFDAAVSAKLTQIDPPADLRASILAGGAVTAAMQAARPWWRHPAWMAAAASVAMFLAVGVALWPNRAEALTDFALADARISAMHGGHGHENNQLQRVLNDPTTRLGQKLPIQFANLLETGCRTVNCRGHEVLELCFQRDGVWFHAYIVRKSDFPGLASGSTPTITDHGRASLAAWADNDHVVLVVSRSGRKSLEALL